MRKLFTIVVAVLLTASIFLPQQAGAQTPEKISYQVVIRDDGGNLVTEQEIGMQISILQGSASGTAVYSETQSPTYNANGLITIEIGTGTLVSGDFSAINWANGPYFIKTKTDPTGGSDYTITGINQLMSVPYALHAKTAEKITETDPSVPPGTQTGEMQYWDGSKWITVSAGNEGQVLTFSGGVPTWTSTAGFNVVENPTTGKIWMDKNLGALQVAITINDANAYGDLYQWGRAADGHESRGSGITSTLSSSDTPGHDNFIINKSSPKDWRNPQNDNLWQGVSGTNNPCPSGYRLPTEAEWEAERTSWSSNNAAGAFASPLKLSVAGGRSDSDGSFGSVGSGGRYWSSTVDGIYSRILGFDSSDAVMYNNFRALGYSVRCIKD
jgi:uncharacterized protein (TIGR02145 family)